MLEIEIIEVSVTQMGFALMLKPPEREKVVPIFIGPLETYSISSALENQKLERPLTHDLMKEAFSSMGYQVVRIVVDDFKVGTFFAKLYIENEKGQGIEIDSRPSDAIAMAIRFGAPIFMSESVYDATAVHIDHIKDKIDKLINRDDDNPLLDDLADIFSVDFSSNVEKRTSDILQSLIDDFNHTPQERKPKIHSSSRPSKNKNLQSKVEVLKQMLRTAVKSENYEEAAKIRDELVCLKKIKPTKKKSIPRKKKTDL